jgi:chromatin segregation and condensation protein Rec8/ScpA/Scc1 (kleisin family)
LAKKKTTKKMSDEHKAALAKGREQGRAVREYLAALSEEKKPGRRVDPETLSQKIAQIQEQIASEPDPAKRVEHIQKRLDLEAQQADTNGHVDLEALEQDFVEAAKEYSERKGITYSAWREAGVPAAVLKAAGIPRTRRPSAA